MRRARVFGDVFGDPREGIKDTIAPAGNVGERARCRAMAPSFRGPHLYDDPVARRRRRDRADRRAPASAANRSNITKTESAPAATSPAAASSRCTTQAARAGRDAPRPSVRRRLRRPSRRDKGHHRASRKCRRESTVQSRARPNCMRARRDNSGPRPNQNRKGRNGAQEPFLKNFSLA